MVGEGLRRAKRQAKRAFKGWMMGKTLWSSAIRTFRRRLWLLGRLGCLGRLDGISLGDGRKRGWKCSGGRILLLLRVHQRRVGTGIRRLEFCNRRFALLDDIRVGEG